jgi:hypothetical protein
LIEGWAQSQPCSDWNATKTPNQNCSVKSFMESWFTEANCERWYGIQTNDSRSDIYIWLLESCDCVKWQGREVNATYRTTIPYSSPWINRKTTLDYPGVFSVTQVSSWVEEGGRQIPSKKGKERCYVTSLKVK